MGIHLDWAGVFTGQPAQWLTSGFLTTIWVTVVGVILATAVTVFLLALRLAGGKAGRAVVAGWVSLFRNTPLLVQLFFWYFGVPALLPEDFVFWLNTPHELGWLAWPSFEFLAAAWGLTLHHGVHCRRVPRRHRLGQRAAA